VVRILVPAQATLQAQAVVQCPSGCYEVAAPEAGHQVWAVRIQDMQRGQTVVLHVTWTTPAVLQTVNGTRQYQLQLYRQAGNHIRYAITIKPPAKSQITLPLPSPFTTPAQTTPGTAAAFSVPVLLKDTRLTLALA
ncbi:MAG: hypothetical protein ACM3N4_00040, partial [Nitrososphaerota archaeon]